MAASVTPSGLGELQHVDNFELVLQQNRDYLKQKLNLESSILLDLLKDYQVISQFEWEHIKCKTKLSEDTQEGEIADNEKQVDELLTVLIRKSKEHYIQFCRLLDETEQGHIVQKLCESEGKVPEKVRKKVAESYLSRYRKMVHWGSGVNPVARDFQDGYTSMSWVKVDRGTADIEQDRLLHYTDMLRDESSRTILIWGEAGMGKTTFCQKLCLEWALTVTEDRTGKESQINKDHRNILSRIGLIMYIIVRDTTCNQPLSEYSSFKLVSSIHGTFSLDQFGKDILLVADGLDEVNFEKTDWLEIIKGNVYPEIKCLVTCRPHASLGIALLTDSEVRLLGFDQEQSKQFVVSYFLNKFPDFPGQAKSLSAKCLEVIESSSELSEMATNPSMLQLMCLVFLNTGKLAKSRVGLFKDYTLYLIHQYEIKHVDNFAKSVPGLFEKYKDILIDAGNLALQGLELSHLQLVFDKEVVLRTAGEKIFQIGFVNEIPSLETQSNKVQFIHKCLQEYLAAYAVVHGPEDQSMQALMNFCSTSKSLMGSQIILSFIMAMSKTMGKAIQKKISELVASMQVSDDIHPKDRVSFLVTMLKENRSLEFPLPTDLHLNMKEEENVSYLPEMFSGLWGTKPLLIHFFCMRSEGVKSIDLILGRKTRLEVINMTNLKSMSVDFQSSHSPDDKKEFKRLVDYNRNFVLECFTDRELISNIKQMTDINIELHRAGMNSKTTEAILKIPANANISLFDPTIKQRQNKKLEAIIPHIRKYKELDVAQFIVDVDFIQAASILPSNVHLSKSEKKISIVDISEADIIVDKDMVKFLSRLSGLMALYAEGTHFTPEAEAELSHCVQKFPQLKKIFLERCGLKDKSCVSLVSSLSAHCPKLKILDLSDNHAAEAITLFSSLLPNFSQLQTLYLDGCGMNNDICVTLVSSLSQHCPELYLLDLSNNPVAKGVAILSKSLKAFHKLRELNLDGCGLHTTVCVILVAGLSHHCPRLEHLDLANNRVSFQGLQQMLAPLQGMRKLIKLCLEGNPCSTEGRYEESIKIALQKTNPNLSIRYQRL